MKTGNLQRLKQIKCFLFDMDGTINLGMELIPGMEGFFDRLKEAGRSYYLVTNNSSKDHGHYVKKMNSMGVPVTKNNILISSDALVSHLKHSKPGARLFVLGTPELKATIKEGGFTLSSRLEDKTDLVVVGFDQTLTYETLTLTLRPIRTCGAPSKAGSIFPTRVLFWPASKPLRAKTRNILQASPTDIW